MAGYSGTPLIKKLGIRPGQAALLVNIPKTITDITEFPEFARSRKSFRNLSGRQFDYIHIFVKERVKLEAMVPKARNVLLPDGTIWVSWPKKASGIKSDINGNVLRNVILPTGLVDVKVCAVDETWSGLKFMFRKDLRGELD